MFRTSFRIRAARLAAAALTGVALTSLTGPAPALAKDFHTTSGAARVTGSARVLYGIVPDDEIWFTIDAEGAPHTRVVPGLPNGLPTDARGTVHFSHRTASGDFRESDATVDCLAGPSPPCPP
ncbi:hypothetical protein [Kitasatospora sp. NPDC017646]|uniref:hypothetical protein n=1 Tax=Kitasatospora sp. NPDC017646 TaxID=3364024 RepID=UPI003799DAF9